MEIPNENRGRDDDTSKIRRINVGGAPSIGEIDNERPLSRTYATATPGCERLGSRPRDACCGRPMKVKGPGRDLVLDFGGRIGCGRVAEGLRSAFAASVWAGRRSIGVNWAVFGRSGLSDRKSVV